MIDPIWLILRSNALHAFVSIAFLMRMGLVTVRSSPTTCPSYLAQKEVHASQSSCSKGSSILQVNDVNEGNVPDDRIFLGKSKV